MSTTRFASFLILVSLVLPALAAEQPACHESPQYLIVERSTGEVGTDFLVKYKSPRAGAIACKYTVAAGDLEIKNESAEYFLALQGDLLILDSGTGPDPRGLVLWDLKKRQKAWSGTYSEPMEVKPDHLAYWMETGEANDANCPERKEWESHGLGAAIETRVRLNLSDFSVTKFADTRCRSRQ